MHEEIKYPLAIKKRVAGDWNCPRCGNLNFSFRTKCNKCESSKPLSNPFGCALYLFPPSIPDDNSDTKWITQTETEYEGFPALTPFLDEEFYEHPGSLHEKENKRKESSENTEFSSDYEKTTAQILKRVKKPSTKKAGDWICLKCLNLNFSFRSFCNICRNSKSDFIQYN
jgi:rubrerythrin